MRTCPCSSSRCWPGFTHLIELREPWTALTSGWTIAVLVLLLIIETVADKVPAVNHANDVIQTIIRPVAGAILFAASSNVFGDIHPVLAMVFESTVITHGLPHPRNLDLARAMESCCYPGWCLPATIAVLDGKICVGLSQPELERLALLPQPRKISLRDFAAALVAVLPGDDCCRHNVCRPPGGIRIFATGGIVAFTASRTSMFPPTCKPYLACLSWLSVLAPRLF